MKQTAYAAVLVLALLTQTLVCISLVPVVSANPNEPPQLSMPIEHINYTVTAVNGTLWAKIDGDYPIFIQNSAEIALPMAYPMPPNSTNIHVYLGDTELVWDNYTQVFPEMLHKTAIGDWWTIYSFLDNLKDSFVLNIHYEHPLERVNDSYMFLYDLNIRDYLSAESSSSIAYFSIRFESNVSDVHVYTAPVDSVASQWQPKNFSQTTEGASQVVQFEMYSQYGEALPGDLVVVFNGGSDGAVENGQEETLPVWVIPVVIDIALVAILIYVKRKTLVSAFSSRKTAT